MVHGNPDSWCSVILGFPLQKKVNILEIQGRTRPGCLRTADSAAPPNTARQDCIALKVAPCQGNEHRRQQAWLAHRQRVQNAKSVVNSQPPVKPKDSKPYKMSFVDLMNTVCSAIQDKCNALSFSNLASLRRSSLSNWSRFGANGGSGPGISVCGVSGGLSANSIGIYGDPCHSGGGDCKRSSFARCNERCMTGAGSEQEHSHISSCAGHSFGNICCVGVCKTCETCRRPHSGGCLAAKTVSLHNRPNCMPMQPQITCPVNTRRGNIGGGDYECNVRKNVYVPDMSCYLPDAPKSRCCHRNNFNKNAVGQTLYWSQSDYHTEATRTELSARKTRTGLPKKIGGIPRHVLHRYQRLAVSNDDVLLRRLLRPRIFFDLELKGIRALGRVAIQLYTEACPEVVLEFVRTCTMQNHERFSFTRLFPPLQMEGELALIDNETLTARNIEHDMNVLDHGASAGILSFPCRYVRGSKRRFLSFSISFKPLKVLNGKRIAFGRVRRGQYILDAIQDYGTNSGKPQREIVVKRCGMLQ